MMLAPPLLSDTTTLVFLRITISVFPEVLNAVAVSYHIFIKDIFRSPDATETWSNSRLAASICWWCLAWLVVLLWHLFFSWRMVFILGVRFPLCGGFKLLYSTGRGSSSTESAITCAEAPILIYWFFNCLFTSFLDMLYTSCLPWCSGSLNP